MKMKKMFLLAGLISLSLSGSAQLLWKISGNGLEKPSYLFGTHHIAPISICDSIAGFNEAFDSCTQLYGELLLDDVKSQSQEVAKYMILPQDSLLDKLYTPEEYRLLDSIVTQNVGISIDRMKGLKPTAINTQLAVSLCTRVFKDFNPDLALDVSLQRKAKEQGKTVKGFETLQAQCELLFGEDLLQQAAALLKTVRHFDRMMTINIETCNAYMKQDLREVWRMLQDPEVGFTPAEMTRLVSGRNHNWLRQLKEILPQQATFIVVGGGHLPGDEGLIELLRGQGFTVNPVR